MDPKTHIVGATSSELTSRATDFYRDYWRVGSGVSETTALRNETLINAFFPTRPVGQRILEIGVGGEGGLLLGLREGNEVHGLDASATGIEGSARLGIPVQPFDADRNTIPYPDDHFDIVLAFEVIEHLSNPQFAVDEIRRVLKPSARFIASTPNPYIHHWPRFFYPPLVVRDGFRNFLLSNRFWLVQELSHGENCYAPILSAPRDRAWSNLWVCDNAKRDVDHLVAAGRYFLEYKDENGVRMFPMEAADLLRAAVALDPHHIEALGGLALALVYRVIYGEQDEFTDVIRKLEVAVTSPNGEAVIAASFRLVLVHAEMLRFGINLLSEDRSAAMISVVATADHSVGEMLAGTLKESLAFAARLLTDRK